MCLDHNMLFVTLTGQSCFRWINRRGRCVLRWSSSFIPAFSIVDFLNKKNCVIVTKGIKILSYLGYIFSIIFKTGKTVVFFLMYFIYLCNFRERWCIHCLLPLFLFYQLHSCVGIYSQTCGRNEMTVPRTLFNELLRSCFKTWYRVNMCCS